jgi:hypothetical protein
VFNWYRLFNHQEFLDLDLPSVEFDVVLDTRPVTVLVTRGIETSVTVDDTVLTINLNGKNPFRYGERAVFLDPNGDVWLGVFSAD